MAALEHLCAERVATSRLPRATSNMNMTPMIDVLLVLLVIFMAALPITQRSLDVNLPTEIQSDEPRGAPPNQIVVEYSGDRRLSINKQDVTAEELEDQLRRIFDERREKTLFIAASGSLRYGDIVTVIDAAKGAGVERVGIITEGMRRAAGVAAAPGGD